MSKFELKIPPVAVFLIAAVLMWLVASLLPTIAISSSLQTFLCTVLVSVGLLFGLCGVISFNKVKTTVNPMVPKNATTLVMRGIYKRTRNPMYVGLLLFLIAWAVLLASLYSVGIIVGFVLYMTEFQIKPEERTLQELFGADYLAYLERVRRWL